MYDTCSGSYLSKKPHLEGSPNLWINHLDKIVKQGCGGGQVVSVLAFYSDDPSSNPAEVYNFSVKLLLKRTKINKKEAGVGPFKKKKIVKQ